MSKTKEVVICLAVASILVLLGAFVFPLAKEFFAIAALLGSAVGGVALIRLAMGKEL